MKAWAASATWAIAIITGLLFFVSIFRRLCRNICCRLVTAVSWCQNREGRRIITPHEVKAIDRARWPAKHQDT